MTTLNQEHRELFRASPVQVAEARRAEARRAESRCVAGFQPDFHSFSLKNDRNEHSEMEMKARHHLFAWCNYDDATFAHSLDMRWKAWMKNKQGLAPE